LEFVSNVKTEGNVCEIKFLCDIVARFGTVAIPEPSLSGNISQVIAST